MSGTPARVIVAGLGAMGSAVACHLARGGARVVGLDRYAPPHPHGSSHGESRIIREAYFEDPLYVPLVQRARALWEELEASSGRPLLRPTGALMLGPPEGGLVAGALRSARTHGLAHERLDAGEVSRRFPAFRPGPETVAVYERRAGVLNPEECVRAHLAGAAAGGAELRFGEPLVSWRADGEGVEVTTDRARYRADRLVLTVGPWLPELLPGLPLVVERQVMLWFAPPGGSERFAPSRCPAFLWERDAGELFYGMPDLGAGVKVARHHGGRTGSVDSLDPEVRAPDVAEVRGFVKRGLADLDGEPLRGVVCRYTNTPTGHFLIDRHPEHAQVEVVSPCSGHGFKFASVVGEVVSQRVLRGEADFALDRFCFGRALA